MESRRMELEHELNKYNLVVRSDSRLAHCYINNKLDESWIIEKVVFEICLTHWLINYTNYQQLCDYTYNFLCRISNDKDKCDEYFKVNVKPHVKLDAIYSMGGIPSKWPWV